MTTQNTGPMRISFALTLVLLLAPIAPLVAQMSVADYIELSIARLELARDTWSEEGRGPTEAEEGDLCTDHGTTAEAYYAFAGEMADEMDSFLDENSHLRDTIEALSAEIRSLIESAEEE